MLSLFNLTLLRPSHARDPVKLNSMSNWEIPDKGSGLPVPGLDDFDPNFIPRREMVKYKRPLTGAEFTCEVQYIESIEKQDILAWRENFLVAAQTCSWSEPHAADYLLALSPRSNCLPPSGSIRKRNHRRTNTFKTRRT